MENLRPAWVIQQNTAANIKKKGGVGVRGKRKQKKTLEGVSHRHKEALTQKPHLQPELAGTGQEGMEAGRETPGGPVADKMRHPPSLQPSTRQLSH